jgi:hypothetical protein
MATSWRAPQLVQKALSPVGSPHCEQTGPSATGASGGVETVAPAAAGSTSGSWVPQLVQNLVV